MHANCPGQSKYKEVILAMKLHETAKNGETVPNVYTGKANATESMKSVES
jgi:hypothetical protein